MPFPVSLAKRLLLAALILIPITLGATGWYLEQAHRRALDAAIAERLQLQVVALLAQAEVSAGFELPLLPLESRLLQPGSGLYAMVSDELGRALWVSPSAALLADPLLRLSADIPALQAGERHDSEREGLIRHAYRVLWQLSDGETLGLRFIVAESAAPREADVQAFREQLLLWLGGTLVLVLLVQVLVVRWGLRPLRMLADRVAHIEDGSRTDLDGSWPDEVRPLVENLETLLSGEQRRRERTRHTLADLAHSLKTPLAVLRSADLQADGYPAIHTEQLERMEEVMAWHLQRATGGHHRLLQRVDIEPVLDRLRSTLLKVYGSRSLELRVTVEPGARYRGDERDLMELFGNLLDNACKYAHKVIEVSVRVTSGDGGLLIHIDDDGDGISPELRDTLLQRGARADSRREGQGIGLAVVLDIVHAQRGTVTLDESPLGGARVAVSLP